MQALTSLNQIITLILNSIQLLQVLSNNIKKPYQDVFLEILVVFTKFLEYRRNQ